MLVMDLKGCKVSKTIPVPEIWKLPQLDLNNRMQQVLEEECKVSMSAKIKTSNLSKSMKNKRMQRRTLS
jgi:hypothetical protein